MSVPELQGVRVLWDSDWHDGPVSGLAEYEGREHWFAAVWDDTIDDWEEPRRYLLSALTDAEVKEEWRWHRLFEEHVSTMHCHHDGAPPPMRHPQSEWPTFYDAQRSRIERNYDDHLVVGEFRIPRR